MSNNRKKVIIRLHTYEAVAGYLSTAVLEETGEIELLDLGGKVLTIPLAGVKWVCFIRDFNSGEIDNPERLLKKTFAGRPRSAGVCLRVRLTDGDLIEGMANNDASLVLGGGLYLTPPDIRSNTQRMFLPRGSIKELEVVMVIGPAVKRKVEPGKAAEDGAEAAVQETLFH